MSKKNVEPLNEFSGRLFISFCFLKQEVGQAMGKHGLTQKAPIWCEIVSWAMCVDPVVQLRLPFHLVLT